VAMTSDQPRIFITGATGFIGAAVINELAERGYHDITALVREHADTRFLKSKGACLVIADITDPSSLDRVLGSFDYVFHCAGLIDNDDTAGLEQINVCGTENVARWAFNRSIRKFLYTSSVAVNEGNDSEILTEGLAYHALCPYGISKIEAEKNVVKYMRQGFPAVIVRPCMVYGQGDPYCMPFLIRYIHQPWACMPFWGRRRWHLVSVRNVAACLVSCMEDNRALGQIFNIADSDILTVREIMRILCEVFLLQSPFSVPGWFADLVKRIPVLKDTMQLPANNHTYSIERIKDFLGFVPPYRSQGELKLAAEYFLEAQLTPKKGILNEK